MIKYGKVRNIMNYDDFRLKFRKYPYILSKDVIRGQKDPQNELNQLNRWTKKGLLIRLRRGMYVLNANDRKASPNINTIANRLYEPSYVSLEYALNFYGLIPESVKDVTSLTTRKTNVFRNELGVFSYSHLKPKAFRGFKEMGSRHAPYYMAEPEKAVADFVYFHLSQFGKDSKDVFEQSYRFQNIDGLSKESLMAYGSLFSNKKLLKTLKVLCHMIDEENT
jgi:hypothetical protein